jgi:hypothetical protein
VETLSLRKHKNSCMSMPHEPEMAQLVLNPVIISFNVHVQGTPSLGGTSDQSGASNEQAWSLCCCSHHEKDLTSRIH